MNAIRIVAAGLAGLLLTAAAAPAEELRWTFGVEADLLPYLSDENSLSASAGRGRYRARLVRAELTMPEIATDDAFRDDELAIVAVVVDRFLREDQAGRWFGVGVEQRHGEVSEGDTGTTHDYRTTMFTAGAGYVWQFGRHLTVNPWVGGHTPIAGDRRVRSPLHDFTIGTTPEASLEIGVTF